MSLLQMQNVFMRKFQQKFKKLASPLMDRLGINQFYHFRVTNSGHFLNLGLHDEFVQYYYSHPTHLTLTPFFHHPKYYRSGISFTQGIAHADFQKIINYGGEHFGVNLSLHVTKKVEDGIVAYGFGLDSKDIKRQIALFHALPFLRLYIDRFEEDISPYKSLFEDNQVDLASLIGPSFYEPSCPIQIESVSLEIFSKQMDLHPLSPLTSREFDVIKHLLNGSPASVIANYLELSKRTVEHYIENIKHKFNCTSKMDLIKILRRLDSIDYFS